MGKLLILLLLTALPLAAEDETPEAAAPTTGDTDQAPDAPTLPDESEGEAPTSSEPASSESDDASPDASTAAASSTAGPAPTSESAPHTAAPDPTPSDAKQSDATQSDATQSDATQSGATQTAAKKPDAASDAAKKKDDAALAALLGPGAAGQKMYVFRGSTLTLQSAFTATSLVPTAELTYNPMAQVGVGVNPVVWFGRVLNITGYVEVQRELTNADLTTYDGELQLSDLFLSGRATNFWTIPFVGVGLSAAGTVIVPTSKWSFAQTMLAGLELNMTAIRAFNVLSGLVFGYQVRGGKNFHAFTTGENESSIQDGRCVNLQFCGIWASNGVRNVEWTMQNRAFVQWSLVDWAGFFVDGRLIHQWLYPQMNKDPRVTFSPDDPLGKYGEQNMRHFTLIFTGIFITPHPATTFSFGTSTFAPQLDPNSRYYVPGFNRFTQIYANLQFNMAGIAGLLDDD